MRTGIPCGGGCSLPVMNRVSITPNGGTLRVGNAGGLNVRFNGQLVGPLGTRGQVRDVVFRNGGYKIRGCRVVFGTGLGITSHSTGSAFHFLVARDALPSAATQRASKREHASAPVIRQVLSQADKSDVASTPQGRFGPSSEVAEYDGTHSCTNLSAYIGRLDGRWPLLRTSRKVDFMAGVR